MPYFSLILGVAGSACFRFLEMLVYMTGRYWDWSLSLSIALMRRFFFLVCAAGEVPLKGKLS